MTTRISRAHSRSFDSGQADRVGEEEICSGMSGVRAGASSATVCGTPWEIDGWGMGSTCTHFR